MPVYEYQGIDAKGKKTSGIVDADNEKAGRLKLRKSGIFTTDIYLEGTKRKMSLGGGRESKSSFFQTVKIAEKAHMVRQLATLLGAGIPLVESLAALQDQLENPLLKKAISQIKERVIEGRRFGDAMKAFPKIFDNLDISMMQAGEASGAMEQVLLRLADFKEAQSKLTSKVRGALMYPLIMSIVGFSMTMYLLVSVVPKIVQMFKDSKAVLPVPTRILMTASDFAQSYWYLILLTIAGSIFAFKKYLKTPAGRLRFDSYSLKAPIFGDLVRKIAISRFSRTLATLLRSGVQLLAALDIVKNVVNNVVLAEAIETTQKSVKEGESITEPLRRSGQFPPMVLHMMAVGEKTGSLESMLEKVANNYDGEVDTVVGTLTTLLEPVMILVMGGVVAFIVLSIMLPILKMSNL